MIITSLTGRIGKDAEVKEFDNGKIITFPVAVDDSYKNKEGVKIERTIWVDCIINVPTNGSTSRAQYLKKGCLVWVHGKPNATAYIKDNEAKASLKIYVAHCENLTWPAKDGEQSQPVNNSSEVFTQGATIDDGLPF